MMFSKDETWTELTFDQDVELDAYERAFGLTTTSSSIGSMLYVYKWCEEHCAQIWSMSEANMIVYLKADDAALFILAYDVH